MKLLAGKLYDPSTAVNKVTTALLAMTALDTTNLRLSFTIPTHGMVRVKMSGVLHGATTMPQVLLGVLEGSTVRGRAAPMLGGGNIAATTHMKAEVDFVLSGLTPGAVNWDAAYSVDVLVSATGLKYGGPNDTTTNNAFGGFAFEIYDPAPAGGAGGGATAQEVWEYATRALTDKAGFGLADSAITAAKIAAAALNGKGDWNIGKTGYTLTQAFPANFSALAITAPGAVTAGTVGDKTGYALATAPLDAAGTRTALGLASANLDTQLSGINAKTTNLPSDPADQSLIIAAADQIRADIAALDTGGGSAGPTAAEIRAEMDANSTKLANLDATVSSRMATFTYAAPDNAGIAAVQAKTDLMVFLGNCLQANTCRINDVVVTGAGTLANKWRALGT